MGSRKKERNIQDFRRGKTGHEKLHEVMQADWASWVHHAVKLQEDD
jgi:hypothetical protein